MTVHVLYSATAGKSEIVGLFPANTPPVFVEKYRYLGEDFKIHGVHLPPGKSRTLFNKRAIIPFPDEQASCEEIKVFREALEHFMTITEGYKNFHWKLNAGGLLD